MQSFSFTHYSIFLLVATLVVLTRCDTSTITSGETSPVAAVSSSETPLGNHLPSTDTMVQNDDSKVEGPSVPPTRLPTSDAATLSPKPSIIHDVTSTQSTATISNNNTTPMINGNDTMGNMAAKKGSGNGSSKRSPGFLVMSTIIFIVSAIYA